MRNVVLAVAVLAMAGLLVLLGVPLLLLGTINSSAAAQCTDPSAGQVVAPAATGANVTDVWANLLAHGFDEVTAAGVMGNIQTESNFDPLIIQGGRRSTNPADAGSGGYGLVQWTPGAKLIPLLHGRPPSIPAQIAALAEQLRTTERAAGLALAQANSPEQAADVFGLRYERYAGPPQPIRAAQARAIYTRYAGSTPAPVTGPTRSPAALPAVDVDLALLCGTTVTAGTAGVLPAGGGVGQDTSAIGCADGQPGRLETAPGDITIRICTLGPFNVNTLLVNNLRALLAAAQADGITFGGGAFRSTASQISLRRAHCGPSTYDIWQRPARQCRPPTAIPGQSLHEWGLAVDFTQGGAGLSRGASGYTWLQANAATYGLINLKSEPWHWSTTGS